VAGTAPTGARPAAPRETDLPAANPAAGDPGWDIPDPPATAAPNRQAPPPRAAATLTAPRPAAVAPVADLAVEPRTEAAGPGIAPTGLPEPAPATAPLANPTAPAGLGAASPPDRPAETAPPLPPPAPARAPPAPIHQLGPVAVALLQSADRAPQLLLRLDPAELGRIEIRIRRGTSAGATAVQVLVERPETLALLRHDAPELERALRAAGLSAANRSLSFGLAADHSGFAEPAPRHGTSDAAGRGQAGSQAGSEMGSQMGGQTGGQPDAQRGGPNPQAGSDTGRGQGPGGPGSEPGMHHGTHQGMHQGMHQGTQHPPGQAPARPAADPAADQRNAAAALRPTDRPGPGAMPPGRVDIAI
jgi:hypothetical protein